MARTIKGTFPLEGASTGEATPSFETDGFVGESCRNATTAFEDAIGGAVHEELKPEFYDVEQRTEHLSEGDA